MELFRGTNIEDIGGSPLVQFLLELDRPDAV
jgi:hypothetical protein